ncbi:MAG: hypothetical protein AAB691_03170 [Patescibacteria group bacterium]
MDERETISWEAPEFEHHEKDVLWAWGSIILAVVVLAFAIINRNFLFAIFIVIAEVLILTWGHREPRDLTFEIDEKNLVIAGRERHALRDLDHFGFIDLGEQHELVELGLVFKKFRPIIRILVPRSSVKTVGDRLKLYGRKAEMEPTVVDIMERLLRF